MTERQTAPSVNWVQAMAGALAAVSSAVLLSTVGVAGTLIGAAIGSVAATVGSAVYSHYLETSKERAAAAAAAARERAARARARKRSAAVGAVADTRKFEQIRLADEDLDEAEEQLEQIESGEGVAKPTLRESLHGLPWKRLGVVAVALFGVVMAAIFAFELIAGRSVSSYTGGSDGARTSLDFRGGNQSQTPVEEPTAPGGESGAPAPEDADPSGFPREGLEEEPSPEVEEEPTVEPTTEPTEAPTPLAPTPTPTPTPSPTPTPTPTSTPTPTPVS